MEELIKIKIDDLGKSVNARELHEFLGIGKDFTTWIKDKINKYGFEEGNDFTFTKIGVGKAWKHEYQLSLNMAKELSMVENNDKGRLARKYFIECEKIAKRVPRLSAQDVLISTLQEQKKIIARVDEIELKLDNKMTIDHAKQRFLQSRIGRRVYVRLNEAINANKNLKDKEVKIKRKMFANIHNEIKNKFMVTSYKDVKEKDFENCIRYVDAWIEHWHVYDIYD